MSSTSTGNESKGSSCTKISSHSRSKPGDWERSSHKKATAAKCRDTILVAVNAAKEVTPHTLEWALTNIVQPGDHINLLALLPGGNTGRKLWSLPKFAGDCTNALKKGINNENFQELEEEINASCSSMMQQLRNLCDAKKVKVNLKVVPGAGKGITAIEAQRVGATWVVLDSQLKKEGKCCMEQLSCNLVRVKKFDSKILRLNLKGCNDAKRTECHSTHQRASQSTQVGHSQSDSVGYFTLDEGTLPSSSELGTSFTATEQCTSSASSSETGTSPHCVYINQVHKQVDSRVAASSIDADAVSESETASDSCIVDALSDSNSDDSDYIGRTASISAEFKSGTFTTRPACMFEPMSVPWMESKHVGGHGHRPLGERWKPLSVTRPNSANATPKPNVRHGRASTPSSPSSASARFSGGGRLSFSMREGGSRRNITSSRSEKSSFVGLKNEANTFPRSQPDFIRLGKSGDSKRVTTTEDLLEKFADWDRDILTGHLPRSNLSELERTSSVRKAMSLSRHAPPGPPPLCSTCQHKSPVFGKPPRRFSYTDLELATGGFSQANFLAEGGFGSVHRGVLPDGQAVAVKQHKLASSQGDIEFCSEVEVLSCAQHRNVVMLIGYCIEDKRRLLVYEFICNGSLDSHLYGKRKNTLEWPARQKIAVGAARGLRYLHEECRVGCIVHRDMRPNNILLTHDFEPMVGDFGLARWQPDGDLGVHTRVIGTFGYLAPEYAQSGQITEKADVYSFGVVLLELVTGRKAVDINRPKGQQCLTEWARPLLDDHAIQELIDPRLDDYNEYEVYCMLHAAALCVRKDPHSRPRMSQVLRILEGDIVIDTSSSTPYSGKLACDLSNYGSRSNRLSTDYVINRLGTQSPPLISCGGYFSHELVDSYARKPPKFRENLMSQSGKLSHEALKAAYKDRCRSRRISYDEIIRAGLKQNLDHTPSLRPFC